MSEAEHQVVEAQETLDIRGEVCPYTFVRTKLALEEMAGGAVLRVLTDYPPATRNIPDSAKAHGHEVLGLRATGEKEWEIFIRKKEG